MQHFFSEETQLKKGQDGGHFANKLLGKISLLPVRAVASHTANWKMHNIKQVWAFHRFTSQTMSFTGQNFMANTIIGWHYNFSQCLQ